MFPQPERKSSSESSQSLLTLMMASAQVVETSVNVTLNSPSQDYNHPDDRTPLSYDMNPGFKPFTIITFFRIHCHHA